MQTRSLRNLSALAAAVLSFARPAAAGPSFDSLVNGNAQAVAAFEAAGPGEPRTAAARALLDTVQTTRGSGANTPDGLNLSCLRLVERQAWTLWDQSAKGSPAADVKRQLGVVKQAYRECGWPDPAPSSLADAERAVAEAEATLTRQKELTAGAACASSYSIPELNKDLVGGRYDWGETEAIRGNGTGNFYVVRYYQFTSLAAGSSAACSPMDPIEPLFVNDAMKTLRSNGMSCRGWVDEQVFVRALTTRSPDMEQRCRDYIKVAYRDLSADEGVEFCGSLTAKLDHPKALCSDLIERGFLGREKYDACVFDFGTFQGPQPEDACSDLNKGASPYPRCQYNTSYARALLTADEEKCGDNRICRALASPAGALRGAKQWETEALDRTCVAFKDRAQVLIRAAERSLSQSEGYLARSPSAGPAAAALRQRIAAARRQTASLGGSLAASGQR